MSTTLSPYSVRVRRTGISLLEIMISIGVVGIGLIGVAALIPLAHHKAAQGVEQDRKTLLGKRAFREFRVRGMDVLHNIADMSTYALQALDPNAFDSPADPDPQLWKYSPFCIDPVVFSYRNGNQVLYPFFPASNTGLIRVPRKTLLAARSAESLMNKVDVASILMRPEQALEVFFLHDDVEVKSSEGQNPPQLVYLDQTKLATNGSYSWIAFISPDRYDNPNDGTFRVGDMFRVSIVVFHRRWLNLDQDANGPREIEATVMNPNLVGGVKSVRLVSSEEDGEFHLGKIKSGDWIMIAAPGTPPNPPTRMEWYRVLMADRLREDRPPFEVNLSIDGPDWTADSSVLQAAYAEGVVAVYEKTIRMQGVSLYE